MTLKSDLNSVKVISRRLMALNLRLGIAKVVGRLMALWH